MSAGNIYLQPDPTTRHRFDRHDPKDWRLGWTACGVRFAWGDFRRATADRHDCSECWR